MGTGHKKRQKKLKAGLSKHGNIDLVAWAEANNLDFDAFSEQVYCTAFVLAGMLLEQAENPETTFKYTQNANGEKWELFIRKVEVPKVVAPKEKKIVIPGEDND